MRHLFEVAAGLDSLVPGEGQILAQLKDAHRLAGGLAAAGGRLGELFQLAFGVGRQARTRTAIGSGRVSVASVAADFATQAFADFSGRCVLSVGAGKMNELMLRGLGRLVPDGFWWRTARRIAPPSWPVLRRRGRAV